MTHMYKALPTGGYTAKPARSAVEEARLLREGWSRTPPIPAAHDDLGTAAPPAPVTEDPPADAPKRGRKAKATVN